VQRIGFIGLGIMGAPMAANLVDAGYEVTGHNRSPEKVQPLVRRGGQAAGSVADATAGADVVVTMLPDSPDVRDVVLGPGGVLEHAAPGLLLIDMSTVAPETSLEVAAAAREHDVRMLDAPVSGGEQGAVDGSLSIMVGGDAADLEGARGVLEAMGGTIVHVGGHGAGQTVKAANQLVVAGTLSLVGEALVLLQASGVDGERALQVLAGGMAGSTVLDRKAATMLARDFRPGFRVDLHDKDMGIALATARAAGVSLPVTGLVAQLVASARAMGHGSSDHSALLQVIEQLSGRQG
jgi:2-hydroxy-3-oxopropionate reductase